MKEEDIRPAEVYEEYLKLSKADAVVFFSDHKCRFDLLCPACDVSDGVPAFHKDGFGYVLCKTCGTLYQSPRPTVEAFQRFYEDSPSSNYWAKTFFPKIAEARRDLIFQPRVERITKYCQEHEVIHNTVIDVGAGHGIFLQEWKKQHPDDLVCAIEPGAKLAKICRNKGILTLETHGEHAKAWEGKADLTTCFEVIEHVHSPLSFLQALLALTKPGGYVLITGLGVDGYDIQTLWEQSKSISPPHHINFMSIKGFELLFKRVGFIDVDLFTPGELDVEIVSKAMATTPGLADKNRFATLLVLKGKQVQKQFQEFLKKNLLSSHVWVIAKRPDIV
jgi:SAM-dependent methyltransferase